MIAGHVTHVLWMMMIQTIVVQLLELCDIFAKEPGGTSIWVNVELYNNNFGR
jgi:hypothetical protein